MRTGPACWPSAVWPPHTTAHWTTPGLLDAGARIVDSLPDRDVRDHPDCLTALGLSELYLERQADAVRHLDRGLTLVRASHRDDGLCQLLLGRSQVAYHGGQLNTAIGLATEAGMSPGASAVTTC